MIMYKPKFLISLKFPELSEFGVYNLQLMNEYFI